jgi:MoxR-like ATPase
VLATQNPLEMEGTYPLPEAQLDRFFFKVNVPFPNSIELVEILNRTTGNDVPVSNQAANGSDILAMRSLARNIPIASHVNAFVVDPIVLHTPTTSRNAFAKIVRYGSSTGGQFYPAPVTALLPIAITLPLMMQCWLPLPCVTGSAHFEWSGRR